MVLKILIFLLMTNLLFAQRDFLNIDLHDIQYNYVLKNAYLIKDQNTNDYIVILEEDRINHVFRYNGDRTLINKVTFDTPKRKYKEIIGHLINKNQIILIKKNKKGNKFSYIAFDLQGKTSIEKEYEIDSKSDRYLESYMLEDRLVMFTLDIYKGVFKKWNLLNDGSFAEEVIDLKKLLRDVGIEEPLEELFKNTNNFSSNLNIIKVNNEVPGDLEISASLNKMYEIDKGFIWTLDHLKEYTIFIKFEKPLFNPKVHKIVKPRVSRGIPYSNSFIFENMIAQVVCSTEELIVVFKSLIEPTTIYNTYRVFKKDEIKFKNSPIFEAQEYIPKNDLKPIASEKTSKLLRKMSYDKTGISIHRMDSLYVVKLGGAKTISRPKSYEWNNFGSITSSYNPTYYAYGMKNEVNVFTWIECLFDENLNHTKGDDIPNNVFNRVNAFIDIEGNLKTESISYIDGKVILGYWKPDEMRYYFKSFE